VGREGPRRTLRKRQQTGGSAKPPYRLHVHATARQSCCLPASRRASMRVTFNRSFPTRRRAKRRSRSRPSPPTTGLRINGPCRSRAGSVRFSRSEASRSAWRRWRNIGLCVLTAPRLPPRFDRVAPKVHNFVSNKTMTFGPYADQEPVIPFCSPSWLKRILVSFYNEDGGNQASSP
jgi:hypothetical protein